MFFKVWLEGPLSNYERPPVELISKTRLSVLSQKQILRDRWRILRYHFGSSKHLKKTLNTITTAHFSNTIQGLYPSAHTILLTLRTLNLHSNNNAQKFTPIYALNSSSRTFNKILKKKQDEKSHDMQNSHQTIVNTIVTLRRNHMTCKNSHQTTVNTIVTSQAQILNQRNYVTERSVQNIHG